MLNHPLFPPEGDDEESPEVESIHVARFGEGGLKYCAYLFGADELNELQQVYEMFGGGNYELVARSNNRISARRRYSIDGRPRPLVYGATVTEAPPVAPSVPIAQPAQPAGGELSLVMQLMVQMQQNNQQMVMAMMNGQTAMATAMLSRDAEANKANLAAMAQLQNQAMANQSQFFQAVLSSKGGAGGGDALKMFREGVDFAKENMPTPDEDDDSMGDTVVQVIEGLKFVGQVAGDGPAEASVEAAQ